VVVDRLRANGKWRNLAKHPPTRLLPPDRLEEFLADHPPIEVLFHLGAISETTATDGDAAWATNVELPLRLWRWCTARGVRFVYASSASTYGDGSLGFDDNWSVDYLERLRPLNLYGWSKHVFDLQVARSLAAGRPRPPQWAGLKFFNVFGPNEYHKRGMVSVVKVKHDEIRAGQTPRLYRSDQPDIEDGGQQRDFIWVGDVVEVMLWLLDTPAASGLFNVGTGQARSYRDLAYAVCDAAGVKRQIEFVDMPETLRGQYQSFTEAGIGRLRDAGYKGHFTPLEEGVRRYVQDFLTQPDPYR
jgi:ADP-L-glycero-D-manno-heptose 6-epimerase